MSAPTLPWFLVFARIRGVGPVRLRKLLSFFGSLERAWRADAFDLVRAGMDDKSVGAIMAAQRDLDPERELAGVCAAGLQALCWDDDAYPALLRHLHDPPPVLFVREQLCLSLPVTDGGQDVLLKIVAVKCVAHDLCGCYEG